MASIVALINFLLNIYVYIIIAAIVVNWLTVFGVMNIKNKIAYSIYKYLNMITEPVFAKVRKFLPPMGGLDLSPIVIFIAIIIIQNILASLV